GFCLRMIFSENRYPLFLIMRYGLATKREPFAGGSFGGPAKHCATSIQRRAGSPVTFRLVSPMLRGCVTTWQNSTPSPSIMFDGCGTFHSQIAPDGAVSRT